MTEQVLAIKDIKGVGSETAKKLTNAGFNSVESVVVTPVRELVERTGIGHDTLWKITQIARTMVKPGCCNALELYRKKQESKKLETGSSALDKLFGGGIETQAITELVGEFSSGKSQICMKLSVMCQLPLDKGGLGGKAYFIDTEGTFSPERIYGIAQNMALDPEEVLSKILYSRAHNSDHQIAIVDGTANILHEENIKLLVVDSIISHFRGEYIGREHLSERQQKLNLHVHKLLRLAEIFNIAVVITNQTQANPQAFYGDPNRPAGGNVLAHATTHRIYLRKSKANTRIAKVMDSPKLPEAKVTFQINENGVGDVNGKDADALEEE
ncbi:MAG: DNA repair and recombination protein RadA [Candidatus Bathyarchaeota archaeon]